MPGVRRKIVFEMVMNFLPQLELEGQLHGPNTCCVSFFRFVFFAFLPLAPRRLKKTRKKTNLTWNVRRMQWKMKEKRLKLDHFKQAEPIPLLMSPDLVDQFQVKQSWVNEVD